MYLRFYEKVYEREGERQEGTGEGRTEKEWERIGEEIRKRKRWGEKGRKDKWDQAQGLTVSSHGLKRQYYSKKFVCPWQTSHPI